MEAYILLGVLGLGTLFAKHRDRQKQPEKETKRPQEEPLTLEQVHSIERARAQTLARAAAYPEDSPLNVVHIDNKRFWGGLAAENPIYSDIAGTTFQASDFTTENMVPHYRGAIKQPQPDNNRMHDAVLEGTRDDAAPPSKREVEPFFSPLMGATNTAGSPVLTELKRAAAEPTGINEMRMNSVMPFQQIQVGPGLGAPYTADPDSYGSDLRILPKTVEDLRTTSNPKTSYPGRIVPGGAPERRGIAPVVPKNRPATVFDTSARGMVPTQAGTTRPAARTAAAPNEERIPGEREYFPPGSGSTASVHSNAPHPTFASLGNHEREMPLPRNAAIPGAGTSSPLAFLDPDNAPSREDSGTRQPPMPPPRGFGAADDASFRPQSLRMSGREQLADSARTAHNINMPAIRGPAQDPRHAPRATLRETTVDRDWLGLADDSRGMPYARLVNDTEKHTAREHAPASLVGRGNPGNAERERPARTTVQVPRARATPDAQAPVPAGAPSGRGIAGAYTITQPQIDKLALMDIAPMAPPGQAGAYARGTHETHRQKIVDGNAPALAPAGSANPAPMSYAQLLTAQTNHVRDSLSEAAGRTPSSSGPNAGAQLAQATTSLPAKPSATVARVSAPNKQYTYAQAAPSSVEKPPLHGDTRLDATILSFLKTNPFAVGPTTRGGAESTVPLALADPSRLPQ